MIKVMCSPYIYLLFLFLTSISFSFLFYSSFLCKTQHTPASLFIVRQVQLRRTEQSYLERASFRPVESGIRVVEEHPRELLIMGPFEMLRHSRTIRPPPSVTVLPLPHDHCVSVLLPLGVHLPSRRPTATRA